MDEEQKTSTACNSDWVALMRHGALKSAGPLLIVVLLAALSACGPRTPEGREALHMQRGKDYLTAKNLPKAAIEFRVASQNMPTDAEPQYQLGMTYLLAGAEQPAIEAFGKALTINPKHQGAEYQMALIETNSNKPADVQKAEEFLSSYLKTHPSDIDGTEGLAIAEAKLGNKDEARRLIDLAASSPTVTHTAAILIALYAANGQTQTAVDIAHDVAARLPNSPDAAILRAQVSLATKDTADADAEIARALTLKRDFKPALQLRLRREIMQDDTKGAESTTQQLAELPEAQMWGAYARLLFAEGRIDDGIAEFEKVLKEHKDSLDARDQYSELLIKAKRNQEAKVIVDGTLTKDKKDKGALLQRAILEVDNGQLDAADADLTTLKELKAPLADLLYQNSRVAALRGDRLRQGDYLAQTLQHNPRFLPARIDLARVMITSGKARDGLSVLEQASAADKRTADYVFYHNLALMSAGDWTEARKGVDMALAAQRLPPFLYQDALLKANNKDLAGARKSLDEALKMAPADTTTLGLLGGVMRQQGQEKQFLAILQDAAAKNPNAVGLQRALGTELAAGGDEQGARAAFESAKKAGNTVDSEIDLALMDIRAGHSDQAQKRLSELAKTHDSGRIEVMLAELEMPHGSPDVVIQHYLKALSLQPTDLAAMNNLADFLSNQPHKMDDAIFWAQKARGLAPQDPVVADTLGWILYKAGKYDTALPFLEESAKKYDRPVAHYHFAAVLAKTGDVKRGQREYEMALKEDPKSPAKAAVAPLFGQ